MSFSLLLPLTIVTSLLLLAACGGGSTAINATPTASYTAPTTGPSPTSQATQSSTGTLNTVQVQIIEHNGHYQFSPATLTIKKGTKVEWINKSDAPHTVTSDSGAFSASNTLEEGQTFSLVFTTAGTYRYHCSIHSYMTATIAVTA
jgi:plastocyanin